MINKLILKFRIFLSLLIILCFFSSIFSSPVFAANLLLNPSFENIENGAPGSWIKNVSTATFSVSSNAKTGTVSASINKTNNTTGLIYLYQDVDVEPDSFYSLSGYAVKNNPNFSWVILRISWRSASGEISKTDSSQLESDSGDFQLLKIESVQVLNQAIKARIELAANIVTPNPTDPVLFEDIDFSQISPPDQPTSTQTPTPTPTFTPTPTPTPKPVSTPTPTPTPRPSASPTTSISPSSKAIPTGLFLVLGESVASTASVAVSEKNDDRTIKPQGKPNFLTPVFLILGALGVLGAGLSLFWLKRKKNIME